MRISGHGLSVWGMIGLAIVGLGPMTFFAWFNKLGDFAKSPQTVEMSIGTTSFVAGGRARIWFSSMELGPTIEISCKDQSRLLSLSDEEPSEEVCGIRVRAIEVKEVPRGRFTILRGKFEVTWQDR